MPERAILLAALKYFGWKVGSVLEDVWRIPVLEVFAHKPDQPPVELRCLHSFIQNLPQRLLLDFIGELRVRSTFIQCKPEGACQFVLVHFRLDAKNRVASQDQGGNRPSFIEACQFLAFGIGDLTVMQQLVGYTYSVELPDSGKSSGTFLWICLFSRLVPSLYVTGETVFLHVAGNLFCVGQSQLGCRVLKIAGGGEVLKGMGRCPVGEGWVFLRNALSLLTVNPSPNQLVGDVGHCAGINAPDSFPSA